MITHELHNHAHPETLDRWNVLFTRGNTDRGFRFGNRPGVVQLGTPRRLQRRVCATPIGRPTGPCCIENQPPQRRMSLSMFDPLGHTTPDKDKEVLRKLSSQARSSAKTEIGLYYPTCAVEIGSWV